jgi:hypothetical protein
MNAHLPAARHLTLFGYIRLDSMTGGEGVRLAQQCSRRRSRC